MKKKFIVGFLCIILLIIIVIIERNAFNENDTNEVQEIVATQQIAEATTITPSATPTIIIITSTPTPQPTAVVIQEVTQVEEIEEDKLIIPTFTATPSPSPMPTATKVVVPTNTPTTAALVANEITVNTEELGTVTAPAVTWTGSKLTKTSGVNKGPSGKETYYNLDMTFCIQRMRRRGYSEADYPYWIRDDGCKMLGPYIMVAAAFNIRPLGTIIECSLGWGIVVDTGGFAKTNPTQLDIAVNWRL